MGGVVTTLVGMPVEPGSKEILVVEVDDNEVSDDLVLAATPGQVAVKVQVSLEEALDKLKPSLEKVVHLLKEMARARPARPRVGTSRLPCRAPAVGLALLAFSPDSLRAA
jgi:hypothetical protein